MIISRTPFRVSFFGGGTDFPEYFKKYGGIVIGSTINKYCYVSVKKIENIFKYKYRIVWSKNEILNEIINSKNPIVRSTLKKLNTKSKVEIHFQADLPKNTGIGSSSAFCVGLINVLKKLENKKVTKIIIANHAIEIEQKILKEFCGSQDQIWSSYGGLNTIIFKKNGKFVVRKLKISSQRKKKLEDNLLLMFTNIQRYSKNIEKNKHLKLNYKINFLNKIKNLAQEGKEILESNKDLKEFGFLLNKYWNLKKKLSPKVTNKKLDFIYKKLINNGALGAKIIGSGGGGFFLVYCEKNKQRKLIKRLNKYQFVNFRFENSGTKIIYNSKD